MIPILLTLVMSQPAPAVKVSYADVVQSIKDSAVRVQYTIGNRTVTSSGTVIAVGDGGFRVLTCAHGVPTDAAVRKSLTVKGLSGPSYAATVKVVDYRREVAVLNVLAKGHKFKASEIAWDETRATLPIIRVGYPHNKARYMVHGKAKDVGGYIGNLPTARLIEVQPLSIQGMSGGGVFRESDGKLIGVTSTVTSAASLKCIEHVLTKSKVMVK